MKENVLFCPLITFLESPPLSPLPSPFRLFLLPHNFQVHVTYFCFKIIFIMCVHISVCTGTIAQVCEVREPLCGVCSLLPLSWALGL